MKKLLYAFAMMTTLFTLTSCEDERIANTLEGTWSGNMYISTRYDGRVYDATYTEVTFLKNPYAYSSGEGYWVDYYSDAPWDYVANHIEWSVDYGTINVRQREIGTNNPRQVGGDCCFYIPAPSVKPASTAFDCRILEFGGTLCVSQILPPIVE